MFLVAALSLLSFIAPAQTVASFSLTPTPGNICQHAGIVFTNTTTSAHWPHLSFYWTFGWDASPSTVSWNTVTPPTITYSGSGSPTVQLNVYDSIDHTTSIYSVVLTVWPVPNVIGFTPISATLACVTDSVSITPLASSPVSHYIWTAPSGVTTTGTTYTTHTSGVYEARAVSSHGCISWPNYYSVGSAYMYLSATASFISDVAWSTADTIATCSNVHPQTAVSIGGGVMPYTYTWNTGATTANVPITASGNYAVTVTDAHGCISRDSMYAIYNLPPDSSIDISYSSYTGSALCDGMIVKMKVNSSGSSVLWSNSSTNDSIFVTESGIYSVAITNTSGCVSHVSYPLSFSPVPTPDIASNDCHFGTSIASLGSTYQWYANSVPIPGATDQYYDSHFSHWYAVRVTNIAGCSGFSPLAYGDCGPLGVDDIAVENFHAYPNPCTDKVSVALPNTPCTILVYDMLGKIVTTQTATGVANISMPVPAGCYHLVITDKDGALLAREQIIKQ